VIGQKKPWEGHAKKKRPGVGENHGGPPKSKETPKIRRKRAATRKKKQNKSNQEKKAKTVPDRRPGEEFPGKTGLTQ